MYKLLIAVPIIFWCIFNIIELKKVFKCELETAKIKTLEKSYVKWLCVIVLFLFFNDIILIWKHLHSF